MTPRGKGREFSLFGPDWENTPKIKNWGCPDWRDRDAYAKNDDSFKGWQWKWEFLRRLPEYRALYHELLRRPVGDTPETGAKNWGQDAYLVRSFSLKKPINPRRKLDKDPFYIIGGFLWMVPSRTWLMDKLEDYPDDPDYVKSFAWWFFNTLYYDGATDDMDDEDAPSIAMIRFDLTKPIAAQLDFAKRILEREIDDQKLAAPVPRFSGKTRNSWQLHLRVIDAKEQGATHQEIYEHFAEELTDGDDDLMDDFYRTGRQPKAVVSRWHTDAIKAMEKVSRLYE